MSRHVDDDYQHPPRVVHRPLQLPREGTPGEGIYLELWQDWCARNPLEWRAIFDTNGPVRQRAASVAASFMVFMGCNGGHGFTYEAERYAKSDLFTTRESAYRAAWANANARRHGVNNGLRLSEFMLAAEHPIAQGPFGARLDWQRVPDITQEDNDILESMVAWWSGPAARVMRSIAEPRIQSENERLRAGWVATRSSSTGGGA